MDRPDRHRLESRFKLISLNTYEDTKQLALTPRPSSEYNDDLHFILDVAGASIRGTVRFQLSRLTLRSFIEGVASSLEGELVDENGDGSINFTRIDTIGHLKVVTKIGGLWADQATITFETDQTALTSFADDLRRLLAASPR